MASKTGEDCGGMVQGFYGEDGIAGDDNREDFVSNPENYNIYD